MTEQQDILSFMLPQPLADSTLYRYLTIDKLLDFFLNKRIPLIRLDQFQDRLEGVSYRHLALNYATEKIKESGLPELGRMINNFGLTAGRGNRTLSMQKKNFQTINFASCWYESDHESIAMWQLYSKPDSVAIRIHYGEILNVLKNNKFELSHPYPEKLRLGKIHYHRFNNHEELGEIAVNKEIQGFVKDYCFQHEQEFRLMLQTTLRPPQKSHSKLSEYERLEKKYEYDHIKNLRVVYMKFNEFEKLPFELVFHPQSHNWHRDNVLNMIKKYELPFIARESSLKNIFI